MDPEDIDTIEVKIDFRLLAPLRRRKDPNGDIVFYCARTTLGGDMTFRSPAKRAPRGWRKHIRRTKSRARPKPK